MTTFDIMMMVATVLAVLRQLTLAYAKISNFYFGMLLNLAFGIAYISAGLWSGLMFTAVHITLTGYGWYRWKYKLNDKENK